MGKGIFTPAIKSHARGQTVEKTVTRSAHTRGQQQPVTVSNNRTRIESNTNTGRTNTGTTSRWNTTTPALDAEDYNQQGDDFDAGQFDKAVASYQQAIKLRPIILKRTSPGGNLFQSLGVMTKRLPPTKSETHSNQIGRKVSRTWHCIPENVDRAKCRKLKVPIWAKDSKQPALSLAYYDEGAAAYNADKFTEAIADYQRS